MKNICHKPKKSFIHYISLSCKINPNFFFLFTALCIVDNCLSHSKKKRSTWRKEKDKNITSNVKEQKQILRKMIEETFVKR